MVTAGGLHDEIRSKIRFKAAEENITLTPGGSGYIGTSKPLYLLPIPVARALAADFARDYADLALEDFVELLESLSRGETHNEYISIGYLLGVYPGLRRRVNPRDLGSWLERAEGWGEVDVICQFNFTAEDMLSNWEEWQTALVDLSRSENIQKRRASLVLLTKPLRESPDGSLADLGFSLIERLQVEREVLIIRAVSWLLRAMVRFHRERVASYLEKNQATLPRIAVRETRNVLLSGVKQKRANN